MAENAIILPENILKCMSAADRKSLGKAGKTAAEAIEQYEYNTEKALQDAVETWCNSQPDVDCRRCRMDKKATTRPGTPDFFCSVAQLALYIECKLPSGQLSAVQEREIAHIRSRQGRVIVVTSLKEVQEVVRELQREQHNMRVVKNYALKILEEYGWTKQN